MTVQLPIMGRWQIYEYFNMYSQTAFLQHLPEICYPVKSQRFRQCFHIINQLKCLIKTFRRLHVRLFTVIWLLYISRFRTREVILIFFSIDLCSKIIFQDSVYYYLISIVVENVKHCNLAELICSRLLTNCKYLLKHNTSLNNDMTFHHKLPFFEQNITFELSLHKLTHESQWDKNIRSNGKGKRRLSVVFQSAV